jgi:uncharacterized protein YyaL (SSP411 family)
MDAANDTLSAAMSLMERSPTGAGQMLLAADLAIGPAQELVLVGPPDDEVLKALRSRFLPRTVVAWRHGAAPASPLDLLFEGRPAGSQGELTLYVCENFTCRAPIVGRQAILSAIASL